MKTGGNCGFALSLFFAGAAMATPVYAGTDTTNIQLLDVNKYQTKIGVKVDNDRVVSIRAQSYGILYQRAGAADTHYCYGIRIRPNAQSRNKGYISDLDLRHVRVLNNQTPPAEPQYLYRFLRRGDQPLNMGGCTVNAKKIGLFTDPSLAGYGHLEAWIISHDDNDEPISYSSLDTAHIPVEVDFPADSYGSGFQEKLYKLEGERLRRKLGQLNSPSLSN